jgi:hypothetical protein
MKAIEQLLRVGVAIEVDVVERMAVARQELLDAQRAGAMRRADHDDVAEAAGDQLDPAEDEGPHRDFAELGVLLDEPKQAPRDRARSPRLARSHAPVPAIGARQHRAFARELSGPVRDDERFRSRNGAQHLHLAAQHDEERKGRWPLPRARRLRDGTPAAHAARSALSGRVVSVGNTWSVADATAFSAIEKLLHPILATRLP